MFIKFTNIIEILLTLIIINKFRIYPVICLRCRTDDGPSEIELKRVTRNCMRKFNKNVTTTATMTAKDFNILQHQQHHQQQQIQQDIMNRGYSDNHYYNQYNNGQRSNIYSHYFNNYHDDYNDYDLNDNDMEVENLYNRNTNYQAQYFNNHHYNNNNNNNNNKQQQKQQQRHENQYQQKSNQQQYNNNKYTNNNQNNNNNNNQNNHNNQYHNNNNQGTQSSTNRTNYQYNHSYNDFFTLLNNHNQKNYNNNNNNNSSNNNDNNRNNRNNNNSIENFCLVHCFFEQMQMLNERRYPDRRKVIYVLTQNIRDHELRNFYIDTTQECFRYVETQRERNDKCAFSRNLIHCIAEYAKANCDDWNEFNMMFS